MTTRIGAVVYKDTPDAKQRFAELGLDTDFEDTFFITLNGTDTNGTHVVPKFVQIDNFDNIGSVNVTINGIKNSVAPYTRTTFEIATYTPEIGIFAYEGTVKIYISEAKLGIGDGTNDLAGKNAYNMGTYYPRDGSAAMLADLDFGGFKGVNVKLPTADGDAANRKFVTDRLKTAADYGVIGDGVADDSDALQKAIDDCAAKNMRKLYCGSARCKITKGIKTTGVALVFDRFNESGLYPVGAGYTALTCSGIIEGMSISIVGGGAVAQDANGAITADARPDIYPLDLGTPDGNSPLAASYIECIRVFGFQRGVRLTAVWDTTFAAFSVQQCGRGDTYAFQTFSTNNTTVNECTFVRLQVEESYCRAIYTDFATLSCNFLKIHSERSYGQVGIPTYFLSGDITLQDMRLTGTNTTGTVSANNMEILGMRIEGFSLNFNVPAPARINVFGGSGGIIGDPSSAGQVNFFGGNLTVNQARGGFNFFGAKLNGYKAGAMSAGVYSNLVNCDVTNFGFEASQSSANVNVINTNVTSTVGGNYANLNIEGTSVFTPTGTWGVAYQKMRVGERATIAGNIDCNFGGFVCNGTITGTFNISSNPATIFGKNSLVRGNVTNWNYPQQAGYLDGFTQGMYCKHPRPFTGGAAGSQYMVTGYNYDGGAWLFERVLTGN